MRFNSRFGYLINSKSKFVNEISSMIEKAIQESVEPMNREQIRHIKGAFKKKVLTRKINSLDMAQYNAFLEFLSSIASLDSEENTLKIIVFLSLWMNEQYNDVKYRDFVDPIIELQPTKEVLETVLLGKTLRDSKIEEFEAKQKDHALSLRKKEKEAKDLERKIAVLSKNIDSLQRQIANANSVDAETEIKMIKLQSANEIRSLKLAEANNKIKALNKELSYYLAQELLRTDNITDKERQVQEDIVSTKITSLVDYFTEPEKELLKGENIMVLTADNHTNLKKLFKEIGATVEVAKAETDGSLSYLNKLKNESKYQFVFVNTSCVDKYYSKIMRKQIRKYDIFGRLAITNLLPNLTILEFIKKSLQDLL